VFLNYRTEDEPYGVALLDRELSDRFGSDTVFLASKSIPLGMPWEQWIFQAVAGSAAMLAIIGSDWLDARTKKGRRRLDDPKDFVRREIVAALKLGKPVIPVRFGVPRLDAADLPPKLKPLAGRQDVEIRFRSNKIDVDRLATELAKLIPELPDPRSTEHVTDDPAPGSNNVVFHNVRARGDIVGRDQINHAPRGRRS
jgi:hypothetical protein